MAEDEPKKPEPTEPEGEPSGSELKEAQNKIADLEKENETLKAEVTAGKADAGRPAKVKTEDEKITDEANKMLEGSGFKV